MSHPSSRWGHSQCSLRSVSGGNATLLADNKTLFYRLAGSTALRSEATLPSNSFYPEVKGLIVLSGNIFSEIGPLNFNTLLLKVNN